MASIKTSYLRFIDQRVGLSDLYRNGLISQKVSNMLPIRDKIDSLMRSGLSHGEAVNHVAREIGYTRQAVYTYLEEKNNERT